jgi:hypothetical protein
MFLRSRALLSNPTAIPDDNRSFRPAEETANACDPDQG